MDIWCLSGEVGLNNAMPIPRCQKISSIWHGNTKWEFSERCGADSNASRYRDARKQKQRISVLDQNCGNIVVPIYAEALFEKIVHRSEKSQRQILISKNKNWKRFFEHRNHHHIIRRFLSIRLSFLHRFSWSLSTNISSSPAVGCHDHLYRLALTHNFLLTLILNIWNHKLITVCFDSHLKLHVQSIAWTCS